MKRFFLKIFSLVLLLSILPVLLFAWDQHLIDLANRFANTPDKVSMQQRAYLYAHNPEINYMAKNGAISDAVFQRNQSFYQNQTRIFVENAASRSGLTVKTQVSLSPPKPGADYDANTSKFDGKVTLKDSQNMRNNVNKEISEFLKSNGQKFKRNVDWSKRLNIDAMPNADQTTQFEIINKWINKKGGTAYTSPEAAEVEKLIRTGKTNQITVKSAATYNQEMNSQINHKLETIQRNNASIAKLQARAKNGTLPPKAVNALQALQAKGEILNAQVAKYLTRKVEINRIMSDKFGVGKPTTMPTQVGEAASRAPNTAAHAEFVVKNARNLMNQADKNFNNTVNNVSRTQLAQDLIKITELKVKDFIHGKAIQTFGDSKLRRIVRAPDRALGKLGYQRGAPGSLQRNMQSYGNTALKGGGIILLAFQFYDVGMEAYRTGNYAQGALNLLIVYGFAKGGEYVITSLFGSFFVANPVTATAIGTFVVAYGLTREIMSRVEIDGKNLDQHTQEFIDSQLYLSDQYDVDAKAQIMKMYLEAIKKGHKLPPDMTLADGWKKILENYDKGGKIFAGIFEPPTGAVHTFIENSTIVNTVEGSAEATGKSKINTGISAVNAKTEDSYIENTGDVEAVAKENSRINTGVSINQSTVQRSFISTRTEGKVEAANNSTINTGLSANNSEIKDSNITSDVEGTFAAQDHSNINAGIQADKTTISNANLSNTVQGANITAKNRSTVNQGTKFDKDANEQPVPDLQFNFGK